MGVVPLCGTEIAVGSVGTRGTMDVFTGRSAQAGGTIEFVPSQHLDIASERS
jgi:hypothetical protein